MKYDLKSKEILIYAAGAIGRKLCLRLEKQGFTVKGFIDKRSEQLGVVEGKAVFNLSALSTLNPKNYAIIITLKNVFLQEKIAHDLFILGFNNIVYKPEAILNNQPDEDDKIIDKVYEELITLEACLIDSVIPVYTPKRLSIIDSAIISAEKHTYKVFLPAEMLFTNETGINIWSCTNLSCTFIITELFESLIVCDDNYKEITKKYSEQYALLTANALGLNYGEDSIPDIIGSRILVFNNMLQKLSLDPDFFIRNCTSVKLKHDGKFVLSASGKNRVCFLIAHNRRYIPVQISQEDYEHYLNRDVAFEFFNYLNTLKNQRLFAPLPHPFFYKYPSVAYNYNEVWLKRTGRLLTQYVFERYKEFKFQEIEILDALQDNNSAKIFLSTLGCQVKKHPSSIGTIERYVDQLFYHELSDKHWNPAHKIQVAFISDSIGQSALINIFSLTEEVIFAYSKNIENFIKLAEKFHFTLVQKIFTSYWDNELYTGVMLRKIKEFN